MKFKNLFKKVENFFQVDSRDADEKSKLELMRALNEKIEATKEKVKNTSSKSKKLKLKKKLAILEDLRKKMDS